MSHGPARCRILLIDDNRQGSVARRIILEDLGYEVATAESGEQGLRCFEDCASKRPFSLVITDYRMPGVRGDEVVRRLRLLDPAVPLVILSGFVRVLALTPESTGADVVLCKGPREHFDLAETVLKIVPEGARRPVKPPALERGSPTAKRPAQAKRGTARGESKAIQ